MKRDILNRSDVACLSLPPENSSYDVSQPRSSHNYRLSNFLSHTCIPLNSLHSPSRSQRSPKVLAPFNLPTLPRQSHPPYSCTDLEAQGSSSLLFNTVRSIAAVSRYIDALEAQGAWQTDFVRSHALRGLIQAHVKVLSLVSLEETCGMRKSGTVPGLVCRVSLIRGCCLSCIEALVGGEKQVELRIE